MSTLKTDIISSTKIVILQNLLEVYVEINNKINDYQENGRKF